MMKKLALTSAILLASMSAPVEAEMDAAAAAAATNYINSKGELMLYGVIGDWWDGLDAMTVVAELERINPTGDLHVRIHSEGGNYLEGLAIYNALKQSERRVVVTIDGMALSMATFVALAGDVIRMPRNAWQFFHFASAPVAGNHEDLRAAADQLEQFSLQAAAAYAEKTGMSVDEWTEIMRGNSWRNATQCLEMGLIDEITDPVEAVAHQIKFSAEMSLPAAVLAFTQLPEQPLPAVAGETPEDDEDEDVKTARMNAGQNPSGTNAGTNPATPQPAADAGMTATTAERARQADLRAIAAQAPSVVTSEMLAEWCDGETTADEARKAVLKLIAKQTSEEMPAGRGGQSGPAADMSADISAALMHRAAPGVHRLDGPNEFAHMSLTDVCRTVMGYHGVSTAGMSPAQIASAALQSTSDLPAIFADVANNELARGYAARQRTFTQFAYRKNMVNFKPANITRMSDAPILLPKTEKGAYEFGHLTDSKETITLQTKGRMINISREMIVNDDMDALSRLPMMMGAQAAMNETRVVYALLANNPAMGETGKSLFHADHKNLATGSALTVDALGILRKLLRQQKSKAAKGETGYALNTPLDFLLVPAALETEAQKVTAQIMASAAADVNPFSNLKLIVEAELDAESEKAFYGFGAPELVDSIVYGYLEGEEGAFIDSELDFSTDGVNLKVRHDFAASVADYRGVAKNPGAS